jgi:hypothetical protein
MPEVTTESSTQQERKITLYATRGGKGKNILSSATTRGELLQTLKLEGYEPSKYHFTESVNRTDLVNDHAILPTGDFTLFIRPKDSKSVASSYTEMKSKITGNPELKVFVRVEAKKLNKNFITVE